MASVADLAPAKRGRDRTKLEILKIELAICFYLIQFAVWIVSVS